jgi:hypothetical protein
VAGDDLGGDLADAAAAGPGGLAEAVEGAGRVELLSRTIRMPLACSITTRWWRACSSCSMIWALRSDSAAALTREATTPA